MKMRMSALDVVSPMGSGRDPTLGLCRCTGRHKGEVEAQEASKSSFDSDVRAWIGLWIPCQHVVEVKGEGTL